MNHLNNGHAGNGHSAGNGHVNRLAGRRRAAQPKGADVTPGSATAIGEREGAGARDEATGQPASGQPAAAAPETPPQPARDLFGRFVRGNPGGPGNPFGRQVAALRKMLLDCVTPADIAVVARQLLTLAKDGNVAAIKVLLAYTVGKPAPTPDPDQLNLQEWALMRDEGQINDALAPEIEKPHPDVMLTLLNVKRHGVTERYKGHVLELNDAWLDPDQRRRVYPEGLDKALEKQGCKPSLDGKTRRQRRKMARAAMRAQTGRK